MKNQSCPYCGRELEWSWSDLCVSCTDEAMWMMQWVMDNEGGQYDEQL